jgi:hypothetical protein
MPFPKGQKNPKAGHNPTWVKGGASPNPKGRPPKGMSLAEKVRSVVGTDGAKLVEMWTAIAYGRLPHPEKKATSSGTLYLESLKALQREADVRDRITCSRLLAERGFGQPKQEVEHSGEVNLPTTVIHEYHASS